METAEEFLTGNYGIVVIPDEETDKIAKQLVDDRIPADAQYRLETGNIAHETLWHGLLKNAPLAEARKIQQTINEMLQGTRFTLSHIGLFDQKYVFWDEDKNQLKQEAHMEAVKMAEFLSPEVDRRALAENLSYTAEMKNSMRLYGHPLMGELFRPHITLAYDTEILKNMAFDPYQREMSVQRVVLAKIGALGRVEKEI